MKPFTPREYQLIAHDQIVEAFKRQVKLLLVMSTGAGKSKTLASFIHKYACYYHWVIVVRKRDLVNQLAQTLSEFDLPFGVFMANDPRFDISKPIQVCSIDTLDSRGILPFINHSKDIILTIDEADESNAPSYQDVIFKYTHRTLQNSNFRNAFLLGMTATPYDDALPHFDEYIEPVKPIELRDKYKTLVDYRYFIPKLLDLSKVEVKNGEFNAKDLDRIINTRDSIAEAFKYWLEYGDNRQTLIFSTNQSHARNWATYINEYYGQEIAVAVDANTSAEERTRIYKMFQNGQIRFLVNVRLITRGVDFPEIGCIIDDAPTLRVNAHLQKIGRGSRINPFYKDCILIDMANNCIPNGPFYPHTPREINLKEGIKRRRNTMGELMKVCCHCFRAAEPHEFINNVCPFCNKSNGKVIKKKLSKAKSKAIELEEATPEKIEQIKMIRDFKKILWQYKNLGTRYPNDIAKIKAHEKLIKLYGLQRVLKIKNAIGYK